MKNLIEKLNLKYMENVELKQDGNNANTLLYAGALQEFLEENLRKSKDEKWTNEVFGAGWIAALMHVKVNFLDQQKV
jgi:hypothetical protein